MAIDQPTVVDIIGVESTTGEVVLTISDHLDWNDSYQHQQMLQDKLNTYLAFIESGELCEKYPNAKGRRPRIDVVFRHKPDAEAYMFLSKAKSIVEKAGYGFRFELFSATPLEI